MLFKDKKVVRANKRGYDAEVKIEFLSETRISMVIKFYMYLWIYILHFIVPKFEVYEKLLDFEKEKLQISVDFSALISSKLYSKPRMTQL